MMTRTPIVTTVQDDDFSDVDGRCGGGDDVDDNREDVLHRSRKGMIYWVISLNYLQLIITAIKRTKELISARNT